MTENDALELVIDKLMIRNLSAALTDMEAWLSTRPKHNDADRLYAIRADFQLMADYWKRGFKDPQLQALYNSLLQRLYVLYADAALNYAVGKSSYLSSVYMRLSMTARDWSVQGLREQLEAFVSEVAMLELEPEHKRTAKRKDLYRAHHQLMSEWFDNVWLSTVWTDGQASAMEEVLLSPTIESRDQQLLVSAITLAIVNHFDACKFRVLLNVYRQSDDELVRQRALIGWVFALDDDVASILYPDVIKPVEELLEDKAVCQELVELQQQLIYCINAERDNQTIQKEIMPDLLQGSSFRVTRDGIEEIDEETSLEDILHPDAEERRMEQVEESFQRMQAMQQQGSDIYFGGFSQMKRFPFFQETCNWFMPFYMEHPGIADALEQFCNNKFLQTLVSVGPFCSSDKYSFVLAFSQVVLRIPESMREMMEQGEASVGEVLLEESRSAAFIRRTYLQDLYRFYRIYPHRAEFRNPFTDGYHYLFFFNRVFSKTHLEPYFTDIAAFLIKQKRMEEAGMVLDNCSKLRFDFRYYMMAGYLIQHGHYVFEAWGRDDLACYQHALELQPENERAMLGYARALFNQKRYEEAIEAYDRLLQWQPEKRGYVLNRAVCFIRLANYAEAVKDLYRLNYEAPDDTNVNRVLAWALTCDDKYEQAERIYAQLLTDDPSAEDLLNYGYCLWFSGNVDEAADCFHRYIKETGQTVQFIIDNEWPLIKEKGITEPERQMMAYVLQ